MLLGFPSPLHRGQWVDGDLADGRYRENAATVTLDLAQTSSLWGTEKASQWYGVYAQAGSADTTFTLKAMPVMRVSSQATQIITLRNNANTSDIGYGFIVNELVNAKILILTGASRGLIRSITANSGDNATGGAITYGGTALSLAPGDWFMVLPQTNFRLLGMVFNDSGSDLAPFTQQGSRTNFLTPRDLASGAINGYTLFDLGLVAPPTARLLQGYAGATSGADLQCAISYDGVNAALLMHAASPSGTFQGMQGAMPFECRVPEGHSLYLNNDNTASQVVRILGWEE
jgi:hypothetical protein